MLSVVSICNIALSHIGGKPIQSLNEQSAEAQSCKLLFEAARDDQLAAQDWTFARQRVALAELGEPPAGWSHRYALPSDCLAARGLAGDPRTGFPAPHRIEGGALLTDAPAAVLVYTGTVTDPARFPPGFSTALSWRLAADLALTQTGKESLHQRCVGMWERAMAKAAADDANLGVPDPARDAMWILARD